MISDEDNGSSDGEFFDYSTENKRSVSTVRVGSRSLPLYPLVIGCLGLLNIILLLTAVVIGIQCGKAGEVSGTHLLTIQELSTEVKQLHTFKTEAIKEQEDTLEALKKVRKTIQQLSVQMKQNMTISDNLEQRLRTLQLEKKTLLSNTSHIKESCGRCLDGWFFLNTSCYFHSKMSVKNWWDSRADCMNRGGNLTVIDDFEEQLNLFEFLPKLDPNQHHLWFREGGTWIGLTDSHSEGKWVWINNATQEHSKGYWVEGEPNNWGPSDGEDCAAFVKFRNPRQAWYDSSCRDYKHWICEMEPLL